MVDIHCHLLNEVDDGAQSLNESIHGLKAAQKAGFTDVILTPHYIEGYYDNTLNLIKEKIETLRYEARKQGLYIDIHHGNEIYMCDNIENLLLNRQVASLAYSRFVLFELPMNVKSFTANTIISRLRQRGFVPIVAHPERYSYVQENYKELETIIRAGAMVQCNYGSIIGQYGVNAQKAIIYFLKNSMIDMMGSDVHRRGHVYEKMPIILKKLRKYISEEEIKEITQISPRRILE